METKKRDGGLEDGDQGGEAIGVFGILSPSLLGAMAYRIKWDSTTETRQSRERGKQERGRAGSKLKTERSLKPGVDPIPYSRADLLWRLNVQSGNGKEYGGRDFSGCRDS